VAVTAFATGTQTAVVGTEHFVSSPNAAGVYVFQVSKRNMQAGDAVEVRIYAKLLSADTEEEVYFGRADGAIIAGDSWIIGGPIPTELAVSSAVRCSIKQTAGSARNFPWKVLAL
jgi:hypothetical protein